MFEITLHKKASKYYEALSDRITKKINDAIEKIGNNPFHGSHIKKLAGKLEGKFRYEIGDLRIVYSVDENKKIVLIEAIGPRGDIYK
ncbi:MAG: hypothetical protein B6D35_06415 [Candidatus Brocadia sp. UTAMX2]|jgi:mRNA interferase RelE/StbE|nr:MAG: hypothetical protein B6D35_06415 [Candidatus Brocadia sp. UTAMX2]